MLVRRGRGGGRGGPDAPRARGARERGGFLAGGIRAWDAARAGRWRAPSRSAWTSCADAASARSASLAGRRRAPGRASGRPATSRRPCRCRSTSSSARAGRRSIASGPSSRCCAGGYRSSIATSVLERLGFSEGHQRRRRHGGVERGEAGSQHAESAGGDAGSRTRDGGWRSSARHCAGIGASRRRSAKAAGSVWESQEVGVGAVEARPEGRGLPLRRRSTRATSTSLAAR